MKHTGAQERVLLLSQRDPSGQRRTELRCLRIVLAKTTRGIFIPPSHSPRSRLHGNNVEDRSEEVVGYSPFRSVEMLPCTNRP
jgi:hypothetical protein